MTTETKYPPRVWIDLNEMFGPDEPVKYNEKYYKAFLTKDEVWGTEFLSTKEHLELLKQAELRAYEDALTVFLEYATTPPVYVDGVGSWDPPSAFMFISFLRNKAASLRKEMLGE